MNLTTTAQSACPTAAKAPWLARLLRRAVCRTLQGLSAVWNLRLSRPRHAAPTLDLASLSPHLQRDLNLSRHAHAQREAAHYERVRERLHWPHF